MQQEKQRQGTETFTWTALPGQGTATAQSSLGMVSRQQLYLSLATAHPALTLSSSAKPQVLLPFTAPCEAPEHPPLPREEASQVGISS